MHLVEMALLHRQRHKPKESVVSQVSTTTYQINTFHGILDFCAIRLDPSSLNGFSFSKIVQHNNGAIYFGRKRSELKRRTQGELMKQPETFFVLLT